MNITRYHLTRDGKHPDESIFREQGQLWLDWSVRGDKGVDLGDPIYEYVTEGRHSTVVRNKWGNYSSCGDEATAYLEALGIGTAEDPWLNRGPFAKGGRPPQAGEWAIGENISDLQRHCPGGLHRPAWADFEPEPGDLVFVNNVYGGHIFVLGRQLSDVEWETYDYGQPGGRRRRKLIKPGQPSHRATVDRNPVEWWLPLWTCVRRVSEMGRLRDARIPEGCAVADGAQEVPFMRADTDPMQPVQED